MIKQTLLNKLLLDNLTTSIILLNNELQIIYLNTAAEMLLSKSLQHCYLLTINDVLVEKTDTITLQQALKKQRPCTKHDACLIINSQNLVADYIITPITEKKQLYFIIEIIILDTLRVSKDEVIASQQQGNKLLIRGLAHEIKNPLGGIRGVTQLLARQLKDEHFKEYTHIIIEEVDRLNKLVNRMLGPNTLPNYKNANIHEVLERVYELIAAESQQQINLSKDYDPSIPEIQIDTEQMIQAILNIVRNAMEVLIRNQVEKPKIIFKTRILRQFNIGIIRHKMVVNIDIIDNGPGIPAEIKDTLFYPMVSGRAEGTGLGLAIAQTIISQHGGLIECNTQSNHTKFSIFLPLEKGIATHD